VPIGRVCSLFLSPPWVNLQQAEGELTTIQSFLDLQRKIRRNLQRCGPALEEKAEFKLVGRKGENDTVDC
jgi:hypothetical protein